jgi:hypothetical protein
VGGEGAGGRHVKTMDVPSAFWAAPHMHCAQNPPKHNNNVTTNATSWKASLSLAHQPRSKVVLHVQHLPLRCS